MQISFWEGKVTEFELYLENGKDTWAQIIKSSINLGKISQHDIFPENPSLKLKGSEAVSKYKYKGLFYKRPNKCTPLKMAELTPLE